MDYIKYPTGVFIICPYNVLIDSKRRMCREISNNNYSYYKIIFKLRSNPRKG